MKSLMKQLEKEFWIYVYAGTIQESISWVSAVLSTEARFQQHANKQLSKNAPNIRNLLPF